MEKCFIFDNGDNCDSDDETCELYSDTVANL